MSNVPLSIVERDFDAVISSRSLLRAWSQSEWPADGFTLEENLNDLQMHERDHLHKEAFTFAIMDDTMCLGCIYLKPLEREIIDLGICRQAGKGRELQAASVQFWLRESHTQREIESTILTTIGQWLDHEWYFDCTVFLVSKTDPVQTRLFVESGFQLAGEFLYEPRNTCWKIYRRIHK